MLKILIDLCEVLGWVLLATSLVLFIGVAVYAIARLTVTIKDNIQGW